MAAYSYKLVMHRDDFQAAIKPAMEACFHTVDDYDGMGSYDGDGWVVAAFLLEQKDAAIKELVAALKGVVAVADRKTDEFDRARAAIAKAEGPAHTSPEQSPDTALKTRERAP